MSNDVLYAISMLLFVVLLCLKDKLLKDTEPITPKADWTGCFERLDELFDYRKTQEKLFASYNLEMFRLRSRLDAFYREWDWECEWYRESAIKRGLHDFNKLEEGCHRRYIVYLDNVTAAMGMFDHEY